ncbi:hypothetical protein [Paenibacillus lutimineralis]|uniref:Uncharacterized protein n=1 Tax=Paenibacillus lutimineralis TaxID=2707005 RepID=A0A3Q9I9T4_9BACL|nr:hypothetical protein [Paenibacillus lutimineralis]AZS15970.1 hypothetical protein EI981_17040 [Paenibacillus lutimineralis]
METPVRNLCAKFCEMEKEVMEIYPDIFTETSSVCADNKLKRNHPSAASHGVVLFIRLPKYRQIYRGARALSPGGGSECFYYSVDSDHPQNISISISVLFIWHHIFSCLIGTACCLKNTSCMQ